MIPTKHMTDAHLHLTDTLAGCRRPGRSLCQDNKVVSPSPQPSPVEGSVVPHDTNNNPCSVLSTVVSCVPHRARPIEGSKAPTGDNANPPTLVLYLSLRQILTSILTRTCEAIAISGWTMESVSSAPERDKCPPVRIFYTARRPGPWRNPVAPSPSNLAATRQRPERAMRRPVA